MFKELLGLHLVVWPKWIMKEGAAGGRTGI
jgi:hypothetical protein